MSLIEIIVLALIQGLTEFLPISSSAHLILPSQVFGWQDQGLAFDVAVHVGTLFAVIIYFRKEVSEILAAWFKSFGSQGTTDDSKLGWFILLATLPSLVIGYFAKDLVEEYSRNAWIIAGTTIGFGLLLWYADKTAKQIKTIYQINWLMALCIGLSQVIAMLLPGTSRSGITMTIGLLMGLNKQSAARFSFLMSIPVIAAAGSYLTYKLISEGDEFNIADIATGAVLSFFAAYACIHFFLKVIEKMGMLPFVIYRLALGAFLVIYLSM